MGNFEIIEFRIRNVNFLFIDKYQKYLKIYCTTMLCSRPWPGESSFTPPPPPTVYGTTLCCDFWKLELLETGVKDFRMHKVRKREIRMNIIKLPNLRFSEKSLWKILLFRGILKQTWNFSRNKADR